MRHLGTDAAISGVRDYLDEIRRTDIRRVDGRQRDPEAVGRMLRSLARKVATKAPATTVAADVGGDDGPLHPETVRGYLDALARLMVVEDQPAWAPHLRSRSILRRSPKRHFVDPSLAAAALRAGPDVLLRGIGISNGVWGLPRRIRRPAPGGKWIVRADAEQRVEGRAMPGARAERGRMRECTTGMCGWAMGGKAAAAPSASEASVG